MIRSAWLTGLWLHRLLRRAPSNIVVTRVREFGGLRLASMAIGVGVLCLMAAILCAALVKAGGPEWLHAPFGLLLWDGMKLTSHGVGGLLRSPARQPTRSGSMPQP